MKAFKTISDPEVFRLLADETRRKIVFLLRAKEMSASQIARELNITPQAVYHHIKKLLEGELVEVTREDRVDHIIESYYRTTAESFHFAVGSTSRDKQYIKEQITTALNALKKLGFKIEYDDKTITQLVDTQIELEQCCGGPKYEDAISEMDDVDFVTKLTVEEYVEVLSMSDQEFARQDRIRKKFRELLKSLVKKSPKAAS
jgi:DNA-binding transcriptional ArsR family regulator